MKISREVKISDDNYGNSTHRVEVAVDPSDLIIVSSLLDQWEASLRSNGPARDEESLTVREYEKLKDQRARFETVLSELARYTLKGD